MTVILNPAGLETLFQSVGVREFVQHEAEKVADRAAGNVRRYFVSAPTLDVDRDVGVSMDGNRATIGIKDAGSKSRRLARAQRDGRVNWLLDAVNGT